MRVPLSWLREIVDVDVPVDELAEILTMGGLEVEALEHPTAGTRGVVVAEVLEVARIEGSDKLHRAVVTDGSDTHEIIAGASNFASPFHSRLSGTEPPPTSATVRASPAKTPGHSRL